MFKPRLIISLIVLGMLCGCSSTLGDTLLHSEDIRQQLLKATPPGTPMESVESYLTARGYKYRIIRSWNADQTALCLFFIGWNERPTGTGCGSEVSGGDVHTIGLIDVQAGQYGLLFPTNVEFAYLFEHGRLTDVGVKKAVTEP